MPRLIQIAWATGIYEGEGTCCRPIRASESKATGKTERTLRAYVYQKDPEILYRMRDLFGGSIWLDAKHAGKGSHWHVSGVSAEYFLKSIYSGLTSRRKAQVDTALGRSAFSCEDAV